MQIQNTYYWFKSVLKPDVCEKIIDMGKKEIERIKKEGGTTEGTTFGDNHKQGMKSDAVPQVDKTIMELKEEHKDVVQNRYVRDSEVCWFNDRWLYDLIHPYVHTANREAGWKYEWDFSESFQFTKYNKGGFYGWHSDGRSCHLGKYKRHIPGLNGANQTGKLPMGYTMNPDMVGKVRKLSVTINLNKPGEYEGGNLKFDFGPHSERERYHECVEIRPRGSMIVFPSFVHHQVTPVTKGTRYSLVLWACGRPFK